MVVLKGWRERWEPRAGRALPWAVAAALAAPAVFVGGWEPAAATLLIAPLTACLRQGVRQTAAAACGAVLLALVACAAHGFEASPSFLLDFLVLVAGGALTVGAAARRASDTAELARITEVARAAEGAILRPVARRIGGVEVCTRHHCPVQGATVGGDVYDVAHTPYGLRVLIGDVCGHDLATLRVTSEVIGAFRDLAYVTPRLSDLARTMDDRVGRVLGPEDFVTALFAEFAPGEVRLVNCGHPAPLRVGLQTRQLEPKEPSPPLGLGPRPALTRAWLQPGDRVLFYTDGLSEARDASGTDFPLLEGVARALGEPLPSDALDALYAGLTGHTKVPLADDVAFVLCQPADPPEAARSRPSGSPAITNARPRC
ncbi:MULTISPECIES: PP2C family protein-serine/threonine phosphatase [Streptomyces]|uniref:PP2C family protein-serine/threonine phosphatase n=1 Tax=Streptomyces TaxID=1883 RepID=UPI0007C7E3CB|nr:MULTISPECIES: PP2C family protein-serine/threonine phosphatase [Streptomyces]